MNEYSTTLPRTLAELFSGLPDEAYIMVQKRALRDNLLELMCEIGEHGYHIYVRYDPLRTENNFTVFVGPPKTSGESQSFGGRLGDTDDPVGFIRHWRDNERVD